MSARQPVSAFLASLPDTDVARLAHDFWLFAGPAQRPPEGAWRTWLLLGGRGGGKTRAGAEWVRALAARDPHVAGDAAGRIALIGEDMADARAVMVEGESGILAIHPRRSRPEWSPSLRRLTFADGTVAQLFSAHDPEGLRGSQFGAAWCDELAKWPQPQETWDMMQFALRLGSDPRVMATTTPKPLPVLTRLMGDASTVVTRARTADNAGHLAPGFHAFLTERYGGTRLGRQELDGEIVEDREDALWRRDWIEAGRVATVPALRRIVVGVDPPATGSARSAACGIVAVGLGEDGRGYVLHDRSVQPASPAKWAAAAVALYQLTQADAIIAEVNQGGDMVRQIIHSLEPAVPVREARASRGKWLRAEPVAALYERGLVHHAGRFPELEDEMCALTRDGLSDGRSPDRLDALVWALSELMLRGRGEPRIRPA